MAGATWVVCFPVVGGMAVCGGGHNAFVDVYACSYVVGPDAACPFKGFIQRSRRQTGFSDVFRFAIFSAFPRIRGWKELQTVFSGTSHSVLIAVPRGRRAFVTREPLVTPHMSKRAQEAAVVGKAEGTTHHIPSWSYRRSNQLRGSLLLCDSVAASERKALVRVVRHALHASRVLLRRPPLSGTGCGSSQDVREI